jgi:hypothetical protein
VIAAEGEVQAASKLAQAVEMISAHPGALQLRLYQTLVEVSGEASSTIVFPLPIDLGIVGGAGGGGATPVQIQAMMQSAIALATNQQTAKQLADAKAKDSAQIDDGGDGGVRRLPGR